MDRNLLPHLAIVLAVHRRGGFAAAAAELGMSASAVSHAVRAVEDHLGQPIFARTTRSVRLTEAGAGFVGVLAPAMGEIGDAVDRFGEALGRVGGVLRINVPHVALPLAMTPLVAEMALRHPGLVIEITCDDGLADIVASGHDAGVRLGHTVAQDMVAVRLTPPFEAIMVATPRYLATAGEPHSIESLQQHNCIGFRFVTSGGVYAWDLRDKEGAHVSVEVPGTVRVTDALYARDLALADVGIAYIFEPLVRADLREGRLRQLLPCSAFGEPGLFLYFPRRAAQAPKLRAFVDLAREMLEKSAETGGHAPSLPG
ncbi:LysR family transcriptional regulator [Variovorax sp. 2RAF20]|jgi:DNA-binding transcriptional LysR family regulator|uniref:LysR family transcriptional regulator n=1 Tax=Variovorax sp. CF313 TaxID=1144315 RepID=UPI00027118B2|nr:LysR family transcriptional regulator [Variovorax sp. CF313]EJL78112.1 transcriptional regulator [Variovorax sp. CF313]